MISQAELKDLRALHQKKVRVERQRFLVEGRKVVSELLASSVRTEALFASEEAAEWIHVVADHHKVPLHVLLPHQLDKVGTLAAGNELIAVAVTPEASAFRAPQAGELMLALDDIHDPRNMGGLLRIADWFGVSRVLCSPECIEIYNPKVVGSSMGSIFRVPVNYAPLVEKLGECVAAGARVFLADMDGTPASKTDLSLPAVLVLGLESHGVSQVVRALVDAALISIPRVGKAESLNVAMAATALCAEFARQNEPG